MAENIDSLFDPNQLGNPHIMFNPARSVLDMSNFDIINCPSIGGGGGGNTVQAGAGISVDSSGGTTTVSLQDLSGAFTSIYPVGTITVDNYGRITQITSQGYFSANATSLQYYMPYTGGSFTGQVLYDVSGAPTQANEIVPKNYVDTNFLNKVAGGNIGATTTYFNNIPTQNNEIATKLYVDNKVATGGGGGSITVLGGTNINVNSTNPSQPVVNLAINQTVDVNTQSLQNVGSINGSGLIFPIGSAGVLSLQSVAGLNLIGGGGISITTPGLLSIGSGNVLGGHTEIEKVSFNEEVIEPVSGGANLVFNGVGEINGINLQPSGNLQTGGTITTQDLAIGNPSHHTDITRISNSVPILTLSNSDTTTKYAILDSGYNPPSLTLSGTGNRTLNIQAKDGYNATTTMTSIGLPTNMFVSNNPSTVLNNGDVVNLTASQGNQTFAYDIGSGQAIINLPTNAPIGTSYFIYINASAGGNILVRTPILQPTTDTTLTANSGCIWTVNQLVFGVSAYVMSDSIGTKLSAYVPLSGTAVGSNITGVLKIDDTGGIQSRYIQTNQIGLVAGQTSLNLNAPTNITGDLAIYKAGGTQTITVGDASGSATALTMTYTGATGNLNINKNIVASNLTLNGTSPANNALVVNNGATTLWGRLNVSGASAGIGLNLTGGHAELNGYNLQNAGAITGTTASITTVGTTTLNATDANFTNSPILNKPASYFTDPYQIPNKLYIDTLFMGGQGIQATSSAGSITNTYYVGNTLWKAHTFLYNGTGTETAYTFTITNPGAVAQYWDLCMQAGGGSGGSSATSAIVGGGGGAGMNCLLYNIPMYQTATYPQTWTLYVGRGATAQTIFGNAGNVGVNSGLSLPADQTPFNIAVEIRAQGGGGGAGSAQSASIPFQAGNAWKKTYGGTTNIGQQCGGGGSGGVGAQNNGGSLFISIPYAQGQLSEEGTFGGFSGGARGTLANQMGGGGGGIRNNGGSSGSPGDAGFGGSGMLLNFDGTLRKLGGGGSGARPSTAPTPAGQVGTWYGGGVGSITGVSLATSGMDNTGSGGGGASVNEASGAGGSGIIMIRYRI